MALSLRDTLPIAVARAVTSPTFIAPFTWHAALRMTSFFRGAVRDIHDHGNNAPTILVVPGFTHTSLNLLEMGETLAETHNVVFAPNLAWYTSSVRTMGVIIRKKSQEVLTTHEKNGDLILLGHSLGGVVAIHSLSSREVLSSGTSAPTPSRLYTLGSPHGGVPAARHLFPIPVLQEIAHPDSLYGGVDTDHISTRVTAITLGQDSLVPPENQGSKNLPKSLRSGRDRFMPDFNHLSPLSKGGISEIYRATRGFTR
jgi:hypothetical protein